MSADAKTNAAIPPRPNEFPIHPLALLMPRPLPEDRQALKLNIKKIGVEEPVMVAKTGRTYSILDGVTRQEIVLELYDEGVHHTDSGEALTLPVFHLDDKLTPEQLLAMVESKSLRRNLNGPQRACRALMFHKERVKLAKLAGNPIKVQGDLASYLAENYGSNRRYMVHVNQLEKEAKPLFDAVYAGAMQLSQAQKAHALSKGKPQTKPVPVSTGGYLDANGKKVPPNLDPVFADLDHFDNIATELRALAKKIKTLANSPSGKYLEGDALAAAITNVSKSVVKAKPYVTCKPCGGTGCDKCNKNGFITELQDSVRRQRNPQAAPAGGTATATP